MGETSETLKSRVSILDSGAIAYQYINCADPVSPFAGRERPPFASDLGIDAPVVVGDNDGREEGEKQNANDAEERTHGERRKVVRTESVPVHPLYLFHDRSTICCCTQEGMSWEDQMLLFQQPRYRRVNWWRIG